MTTTSLGSFGSGGHGNEDDVGFMGYEWHRVPGVRMTHSLQIR